MRETEKERDNERQIKQIDIETEMETEKNIQSYIGMLALTLLTWIAVVVAVAV